MAQFEAKTRRDDAAFHQRQREKNEREEAEKIAEHLDTDLPTYDSLFPTPIASAPVIAESLQGNASQVSESSIPESCSSKIGQMDLGSKYEPSLWYYEPGNNPVTYELGQRVSNPFTAPLRALQSDADRKKLKRVVTRNDFTAKYFVFKIGILTIFEISRNLAY